MVEKMNLQDKDDVKDDNDYDNDCDDKSNNDYTGNDYVITMI